MAGTNDFCYRFKIERARKCGGLATDWPKRFGKWPTN